MYSRLTWPELEHRAQMIEAVCGAWRDPSCAERLSAIASRANDGMDAENVAAQLNRITSWKHQLLIELVEAELGTDLALVMAPQRILHLASGSVPGLGIDSLIPTLMLGCHQLIKTSERDRELAGFVAVLRNTAPELGKLVTLTESIDWSAPDAAVVWGTNATIALVRHKLGQTAPIAAYGERTSLAVIHGPDLADAKLFDQTISGLQRDVSMFNGEGCMTPQELILVGELPPSVSAEQLEEIAGIKPKVAANVDELAETLSEFGTELQTVVIGAAPDTCDDLAIVAIRCGATRVCLPGQAHSPSLLAPHDGRGRLRDLVRRVSVS
jgi:hypothetical protein